MTKDGRSNLANVYSRYIRGFQFNKAFERHMAWIHALILYTTRHIQDFIVRRYIESFATGVFGPPAGHPTPRTGGSWHSSGGPASDQCETEYFYASKSFTHHLGQSHTIALRLLFKNWFFGPRRGEKPLKQVISSDIPKTDATNYPFAGLVRGPGLPLINRIAYVAWNLGPHIATSDAASTCAVGRYRRHLGFSILFSSGARDSDREIRADTHDRRGALRLGHSMSG